MKHYKASRRRVLKQLASMTALAALSVFRTGSVFASSVTEKFYGTKIAGVKGKVIARQDSNYELWRRAMIWHHSKPKRYPELIVQVQSTEDVVAAVKYAALNKLKVSMRAGGHNSTGTSVRQGGMVLDLSALRDIRIDTEKKLHLYNPAYAVLT
jgi:hypothetical protein